MLFRSQDLIAQAFARIIANLGTAAAPGILGAVRANISAQEKAVFDRMTSDVKQEIDRQGTNNQIEPKPNYTKALKTLFDLFG